MLKGQTQEKTRALLSPEFGLFMDTPFVQPPGSSWKVRIMRKSDRPVWRGPLTTLRWPGSNCCLSRTETGTVTENCTEIGKLSQTWLFKPSCSQFYLQKRSRLHSFANIFKNGFGNGNGNYFRKIKVSHGNSLLLWIAGCPDIQSRYQ